MCEPRSVVLQRTIAAALTITAGMLANPGCTGDQGPQGDPGAAGPPGMQGPPGNDDAAAKLPTATPIKHVVIIFGENVSFDHYFGTYPTAKNLAGETRFVAAAGTPKPNNLATPLDDFMKGVLSTSNIIFYVSLAFVGVFLTYRSVDSLRWRG